MYIYMSFKTHINFFLIPLFILVGSGCENVSSFEEKEVGESMKMQSIKIWISPYYRGDSTYVQMPVSRRGQR